MAAAYSCKRTQAAMEFLGTLGKVSSLRRIPIQGKTPLRRLRVSIKAPQGGVIVLVCTIFKDVVEITATSAKWFTYYQGAVRTLVDKALFWRLIYSGSTVATYTLTGFEFDDPLGQFLNDIRQKNKTWLESQPFTPTLTAADEAA